MYNKAVITETIPEYKVKTPVFEGPLEVLLRLVEERKLFINEISLAQVTDDYIAYVRSLREKNLSQVTGFLVIAATLLLIKSKSLLPNLELTEDEEGQIGDLEARLRMYQVIKEVSKNIKEKFGRQIIFGTSEKELFSPIFSPDPSITLPNILEAISLVIEAMPKKEFLPKVKMGRVINIEEVINSLIKRIQNSLSVSFSEFASDHKADSPKEKKIYFIVSFLAMLELVRTGILAVAQENNFEDIIIERQGLGSRD
ncbi:hypothetical protein A3A09_03605 [Candidatus Nomurabacteria bacterium RIFCSPLOWO2_01_FULL_42_20]|nr:MAG: hypothetical protein A3A09_03605 [Candidatus Nomurabacteria bacterium RIFCSPLOWO2_01_FULL_42_20]